MSVAELALIAVIAAPALAGLAVLVWGILTLVREGRRWSGDPFRNYDAWLEAPYQRRQAEAERLECPECDAQMAEDKAERSVECPECGYADGYDWDAAAEAAAEARWDDR